MGVLGNNALVGASAAGAAGSDFYDYQIANSCRFGVLNSYLTRAISGVTDNTQNTISFWVKRSKLTGAAAYSRQPVMGNSNGAGQLEFEDDDTFRYASYGTLQSSAQLFRDSSAWYHFYIYRSTSNDGGAIYVNGVQVSLTTNTAGSAGIFQNGESLQIGASNNGSTVFDGYIADVYGIYDQNIAHTEFGELKNGVWIPKDAASAITFGSHDFHLKFESSSDLGNDSSGNNNDFTATNMSAHDQMTDTPTFNSSSSGGNFATIGPLWKTSDMTFSEGNLKWTCSTNERGLMSNWAVPIGTKAYWEYKPVSWGGNTSNGDEMWIGINQGIAALVGGDRGGKTTAYAYGTSNGYKTILASASSYGATIRSGDIVGVAVDRVNHTINFSKNNSWQGTFAISSTMDLFPFIGSGGGSSSASGIFNFGADGTFAGTVTAQGNSDDTGYGNFYYDPPTGYLALCSGNLPVADAVDPAQTNDDYPQLLFSPLIWTGDGNTTRSFTLNFKPDFSWAKQRSHTYQHTLYDTSRTYATLKALGSSGTWIEGGGGDNSSNGYFSSSDSSGFSVNRGTNTSAGTSLTNSSSTTYASWHWRCNAGTTSTNTQGDTNSTVQVDPSGHFSIVLGTGDNDNWGNPQTFGHGLSAAPNCIIGKKRADNADEWQVFFSDYGDYSIGGSNAACNSLVLNQNAALYTNQSYKGWGGVMPTSTVFTLDGNNLVGNGDTFVCYCFANCEGYIKSGSYKGNGNGSDGSFIYTGFAVSWLLVKRVDSSGAWYIQDNTRDPYNPVYHVLKAQNDNAEEALTDGTDYNDFLSNGFKVARGGDAANFNTSGATYVYLAMAENPFKYATAR